MKHRFWLCAFILVMALALAGCMGAAAPSGALPGSGPQAPSSGDPPAASAAESTPPADGSVNGEVCDSIHLMDVLNKIVDESVNWEVCDSLAPEALEAGHFASVDFDGKAEHAPYLELYTDGTFMFMCNVYQGMTTYLGTWEYADGALTLDRPSEGETYAFEVLSEDILVLRSGDLGATQPGNTFLREA